MGHDIPDPRQCYSRSVSEHNRRKLWQLNYQEAAIFLQEGKDNDKFNTHPRTHEALPAYEVAHNHWFHLLDLVAAIMIMLLAISERPAVDFFSMPVGVHGSIELLCLLLLSLDLFIRYKWLGFHTFLRHKRTMIKLGMILLMMTEAITVLVRQMNHFRVTRALRPIFLIHSHYCQGIRSYPDVMMPAYSVSKFYALFFIIYLSLELYFLMNLLLAVVYDTFSNLEKGKLKALFLHKREACVNAFRLLVTTKARELRHLRFDFLVTVVSLVGVFGELFDDSFYFIMVLRPFRLLRLFKIKRRYRDVLGTLFVLFHRLISLVIVIVLVYYFFAIIGMEVFLNVDLQNCCKSEGYAKAVSEWARLYFMLFYIVMMVVMNIVVAFVLESFMFRIQYRRQMALEDIEADHGVQKVEVTLNEQELQMCNDERAPLTGYYISDNNANSREKCVFIGERTRSREDFSMRMYSDEVQEWAEEFNKARQTTVDTLVELRQRHRQRPNSQLSDSNNDFDTVMDTPPDGVFSDP
nr:hypothetical protein BaRGS_029618 [Batillaria attramentaria]